MSKCANPTVEIEGQVTLRSGEPVEGAAVGVSWVRKSSPQGPAQAFTDSNGQFRVSFRFDTFEKSSMFRGDVCGAKLSQVTVTASTPSLRSDAIGVQVKEWNGRVHLFVDPFRE